MDTLRAFSFVDWLGVPFWLALWCGYCRYLVLLGQQPGSLSKLVANLHRQWMNQAYARDPRVSDASLLGNLMKCATFFSSTTLFILGTCFAFLGTIERGGSAVLQHLPFASNVQNDVMEFKVVLISLVFLYAFVRFSWALRQLNLLNVVVGAFPSRSNSPLQKEGLISTASRLGDLAGQNFAQGLRAYYYAVPLLLWIVNPWLLIWSSIGMTLACYVIDFSSPTTQALHEIRPNTNQIHSDQPN